ncbi:MAG: aminopeptidase P family protein [Candidatus Omnitrophota bacterium]
MFDANVYIERRNALKDRIQSGIILFPGNIESPMNYPANTFRFRQDSTFLYFFGLDNPGLFGFIDVDENKDYMVGDDYTLDDIIWMGPQPTIKHLAHGVGVENAVTPAQMADKIKMAIAQQRKIHFLPPYRPENSLQLESLLGISAGMLKQYASVDLIKAVAALRSVKSDLEIKEIEEALDISFEMYTAAMQMALPGTCEREIAGRLEGIANALGCGMAFPAILSIHGETLHNHHHGNILKKGDLLVVDTGAESLRHYASDITRTYPVGGTFTDKQRAIYEIVLNAQQAAIDAIKPDQSFKDIHMRTALIIAEGLKGLGLMKGDMAQAVKEGAHAMFLPHGLGHMMGLDVHDMEDIGEDYVGYDSTVQRSRQFGLAYLRLAKTLQPGYVLTVEPGIYFIPALINKWKAENTGREFINFDRVEEYKDFGGIRIEDNVLVTDDADGHRVLGKSIPKTVDEIEALMN